MRRTRRTTSVVRLRSAPIGCHPWSVHTKRHTIDCAPHRRAALTPLERTGVGPPSQVRRRRLECPGCLTPIPGPAPGSARNSSCHRLWAGWGRTAHRTDGGHLLLRRWSLWTLARTSTTSATSRSGFRTTARAHDCGKRLKARRRRYGRVGGCFGYPASRFTKEAHKRSRRRWL